MPQRRIAAGRHRDTVESETMQYERRVICNFMTEQSQKLADCRPRRT
ncbi:hypothetical protein Salmuc_04805 [Salipiger mucosus DSM 16094]|uniref:Uncharacterized protein n=1 Tax=Salipiger mucosus DSM 16094 TaxID=1123237 RepID=S9SGY3_9RHOB|nr:hypothetical protein Salmuc_04805 [Salipiger mucosus DSM 16094]